MTNLRLRLGEKPALGRENGGTGSAGRWQPASASGGTFQAVGASGHQGGFVGVDRGHGVVAARIAFSSWRFIPAARGLLEGESARWTSGRDFSNNVLVYWSEDSRERPSAGAGCWLFDSSSGSWSANRGLAGTFPFSLPRLGVCEPPAAPASGS